MIMPNTRRYEKELYASCDETGIKIYAVTFEGDAHIHYFMPIQSIANIQAQKLNANEDF